MARCNPKPDSNCWVKICIATDLEPKECVTIGDSIMSPYLEQFGMKSYLTMIQNSDATVTVGFFIYSGQYNNAENIQKVILDLDFRNIF